MQDKNTAITVSDKQQGGFSRSRSPDKIDKSIKKPVRLTVKEKKFVANKLKGDRNIDAYRKAGYSMASKASAVVEASKINAKPKIQEAIDRALIDNELTPDYAIKELKTVVDQNMQLGAKRLAILDVLNLHGWNKDSRPNVTLEVKNAWFGTARQDDTLEG